MNVALDISTSALVAQRIRLDAIASNIANVSTVKNEAGQAEPYRPRFVVFQTDSQIATPHGAKGVKAAEVKTDDGPPKLRYQPEHPLANAQGYVAYPNVNLTQEFVDALSATRSYEANLGVIEVTKDMGRQTLRILG